MLAIYQVVPMIAKATFKTPHAETVKAMYLLNNEKISVISHVKQSNRNSPANHLQVILDAFNMFNWPLYNSRAEFIDMTKEYHG